MQHPCCEDWKPQTQILSDYMMYGVIHGMGDHLKRGGIEFRYCPWCGTNRAAEGLGSESSAQVTATAVTVFFHCLFRLHRMASYKPAAKARTIYFCWDCG